MEEHYSIAIIGGGAAGLFAGSILGKKAIILERNNSIAEKLLLTGGGRCNYTHDSTLPELLEHYNAKSSFIRPALYALPPSGIIKKFISYGIEPRIEKNGKVFPASGNSSSIVKALEERCGTIKNNSFTRTIRKDGNIFILETDKETITADFIIIATGGNSYPHTGSDGYGYTIARSLGHNIAIPTPALAQLRLSYDLSQAEGISLPITIRLGKKDYSGDVVITRNGISGPLAEDISYMFPTWRKISISFMECDFKKLREANGKSIVKNVLAIPNRLTQALIGKLSERKIATLTKEEENNITKAISNLECNAISIAKSAMSTHGGVLTSEIDSKSMESKLVENLYFAGDIIDVDANCGGYSLTWAFASAYLAAKSIISKQELR